jgi:staphylococcal nuclease domain-containing protein 1
MGNPQQFLDEWKGKTADGLVERVLSGNRMLLRLIISPTKHVQVMALVGGIRAPSPERVSLSNQQVQPAEEFGNEAKQFIEDRLLQRNVKVDVLGLSPQNQLIASIRHPKGSIAKFLLEAGLARCTDNHSTLLGSDMAPLRQAEKEAQSGKRGLFKEDLATVHEYSVEQGSNATELFAA